MTVPRRLLRPLRRDPSQDPHGFRYGRALTDVLVRDLGDLTQDFPDVSGETSFSHGLAHVNLIGRPARFVVKAARGLGFGFDAL